MWTENQMEEWMKKNERNVFTVKWTKLFIMDLPEWDKKIKVEKYFEKQWLKA